MAEDVRESIEVATIEKDEVVLVVQIKLLDVANSYLAIHQRASEPPVTKPQKAVQQLKDEDGDEGPAEEEGDEDGAAEGGEDHGETLCGACGDNYASDEFWICCDICEKWFHGKCVKITPARAEHIKQYKCPSCSTSSKRARPS